MTEDMIPTMLVRNWWSLSLRGLFALIFGILALAWPGITLLVLLIFFAAFVLVDGLFAVIAGFAERKTNPHWWLVVLVGIAGIAIGIITFAWPAATALVLLFLIAAWAIITGILQVVLAIQLRRQIENEWLLILEGVISFLFGVVIAAIPVAGALAIVWLIGIFAIVIGIIGIFLGFRLRSEGKKMAASGAAMR